MTVLIDRVKSFLVEDAGPTATEYATMLALLVVALIGTLQLLKDGWVTLYTAIGASVG